METDILKQQTTNRQNSHQFYGKNYGGANTLPLTSPSFANAATSVNTPIFNPIPTNPTNGTTTVHQPQFITSTLSPVSFAANSGIQQLPSATTSVPLFPISLQQQTLQNPLQARASPTTTTTTTTNFTYQLASPALSAPISLQPQQQQSHQPQPFTAAAAVAAASGVAVGQSSFSQFSPLSQLNLQSQQQPVSHFHVVNHYPQQQQQASTTVTAGAHLSPNVFFENTTNTIPKQQPTTIIPPYNPQSQQLISQQQQQFISTIKPPQYSPTRLDPLSTFNNPPPAHHQHSMSYQYSGSQSIGGGYAAETLRPSYDRSVSSKTPEKPAFSQLMHSHFEIRKDVAVDADVRDFVEKQLSEQQNSRPRQFSHTQIPRSQYVPSPATFQIDAPSNDRFAYYPNSSSSLNSYSQKKQTPFAGASFYKSDQKPLGSSPSKRNFSYLDWDAVPRGRLANEVSASTYAQYQNENKTTVKPTARSFVGVGTQSDGKRSKEIYTSNPRLALANSNHNQIPYTQQDEFLKERDLRFMFEKRIGDYLKEYFQALVDLEREIESNRIKLIKLPDYSVQLFYEIFDAKESGQISTEDILAGLKKLRIDPDIHDIQLLTHRYSLTKDTQKLDQQEFVNMIVPSTCKHIDSIFMRKAYVSERNMKEETKNGMSMVMKSLLNAEVVLESIRLKISNSQVNLKELFATISESEKEPVNRQNLRQLFISMGIFINKEEIVSIMQRFDPKDMGFFREADFEAEMRPRNI